GSPGAVPGRQRIPPRLGAATGALALGRGARVSRVPGKRPLALRAPCGSGRVLRRPAPSRARRGAPRRRDPHRSFRSGRVPRGLPQGNRALAFPHRPARHAVAQALRTDAGVRALVIAPQPFFTPRGTPFSVYYRTLMLAKQGVEIDLLTYGEGQDVDLAGVRILRIPRFRFLGPVEVGPSRTKLFLDAFLVLRTLGLLLRKRYDFVHAHEEAVFFCRFLKPL